MARHLDVALPTDGPKLDIEACFRANPEIGILGNGGNRRFYFIREGEPVERDNLADLLDALADHKRDHELGDVVRVYED